MATIQIDLQYTGSYTYERVYDCHVGDTIIVNHTVYSESPLTYMTLSGGKSATTPDNWKRKTPETPIPPFMTWTVFSKIQYPFFDGQGVADRVGSFSLAVYRGVAAEGYALREDGGVTINVTAAPKLMFGKVNGTWVKGQPYVKVGGHWKKVTDTYSKINGSWKKSA